MSDDVVIELTVPAEEVSQVEIELGVVGQGLGKAKEVQEAIAKGIDDAKKNLLKVPVMHGTIPHEQWAKQGAAKVLIKPAAHGAGVIAGGSMRAVLESAVVS